MNRLLLKLLLSLAPVGLIAEPSFFISKESEYTQNLRKFDQFYRSVPIQSLEGVRGDADSPVRIEYKKFLRPDSKASIVLVHGLSENFYKYQEMAYDFYQNSYNVYVFNQRGHGASKLYEDQKNIHVEDFDHYVEDLHRLITAKVKPLGKPILLFAHSMGGGIATRYMQEYPEMIDAAVLSAPMLGMKTGGFPEWMARSLAASGDVMGLGRSLAPGQSDPSNDWQFEAKANTHSRIRWNHYRDFSINPDWQHLRRGGVTLAWVRAAFAATDAAMAAENIQKMQTPILMFQAEIDTWVEPKPQERFCEANAQCELVKVEEAKHEIWFEADRIRIPYMTKVMKFYQKALRPSLPRDIATSK